MNLTTKMLDSELGWVYNSLESIQNGV
jgi:hypothetical protein